MQSYKIELLESVGNVKFGMLKNKVRKLLGNYNFFANIPNYDEFELCHTFYDKKDKLVFICFTHLEKTNLILDNKNLSKMTISELSEHISNYSGNFKVNYDKGKLECDELGLTATFGITNETKSSKESMVKTLCFTIKDYQRKCENDEL